MNPFEELELDPRLDPDELTDALKRRAEKAEGAEKARIQELWRTLTMNERDRVRWAFFAHPRPGDQASTIEALRDKIPPVIVRGAYEPPTPTLGDVLRLKSWAEPAQRERPAPPRLPED